MSDCAHTVRNGIDEKHDIWQCCQCGVIGRIDEILYFPVEAGTTPTRDSLYDRIAELKAENLSTIEKAGEIAATLMQRAEQAEAEVEQMREDESVLEQAIADLKFEVERLSEKFSFIEENPGRTVEHVLSMWERRWAEREKP